MKNYWRKLDDQAKIFALASNKNYSSVFRLSVLLKENIEQDVLKKALELALEKYKAFKVKMKKGLFWYYLEENEKKPIVTIENDYPFKKVNTRKNKEYLFKVTYFKNKINIDFFHALTDGNGGTVFFREIIYKYLEIKYPNDFDKATNSLDKMVYDSENAYIKNYIKTESSKNSRQKAYLIKGKALPKGIIGINHFFINLEQFKNETKKEKCSISMYLIAMIAYSIYTSNSKPNDLKNPIKICVPVNLKKYCDSDTISNFFSYILINLKFNNKKEYSFYDILKDVKKQFENKLQLEKIIKTISIDAASTNKFYIRMIPLFLKRFAIKIGSLYFKKCTTMTFSNIGPIEIDNKYKKYIDNFLVTLSPDWAEKIKCGVCSYDNMLVVSFGTNLKEALVEKNFKQRLEERKIKFCIKGNGVNVI